jgi:hypothetical protein
MIPARALTATVASSIALPLLVLATASGSASWPGTDGATDPAASTARAALRIEMRCSVGGWTALEPLGEREDDAVWTGTADCRADASFLHAAGTTVELLWEADERIVTWQGATWRGPRASVEMPPARGRAVHVPDGSGWRVSFEGRLGPDAGAGSAGGRAYLMTARLELPLGSPRAPSAP